MEYVFLKILIIINKLLLKLNNFLHVRSLDSCIQYIRFSNFQYKLNRLVLHFSNRGNFLNRLYINHHYKTRIIKKLLNIFNIFKKILKITDSQDLSVLRTFPFSQVKHPTLSQVSQLSFVHNLQLLPRS